MNNETSMNELDGRRFLLGEMSGTERVAFEQKFIEDAEIFDELLVAEDELIEAYVRGNLSSDETAKFEKSFLTTQKRRERVAFAREMIAQLSPETVFKKRVSDEMSVPFWAGILNFLKQPQWAFGLGFLILILFAVWWLRPSNGEAPTELVKQTPTPQNSTIQTPTPAPTPETGINQTLPKNNADNRPVPERPANNLRNSNENLTPKTTASPKPTTVTLALFTGGVRSEGKNNEIDLPKEINGLNLQLNLEKNDYQTYRTEILDQNGRSVYRSGKLFAKNLRLNTFVPARNLSRGDFIVKIYGQNPTGAEESVADYQFRVNRK